MTGGLPRLGLKIQFLLCVLSVSPARSASAVRLA